MDGERFRALGHSLVDQIASLLESVPRGPVTRHESPAAVREALGLNSGLPDTGTDAATLLASTAQQLFEHSLFNGHPRFFGYITSSPAPIGILGDFLASAVNPNVGAWTLSPRLLPLRRARHQLRRLRASELARLPGPQGLVGALPCDG